MKKHIVVALKSAGLPLSTPMSHNGAGHIRIHVGKRFVVTSCTPSCGNAAKNLTKDLIRAVETGGRHES